MTKLFSTTVSIAVTLVGVALAAAPAHAATRLMSSSIDAFEYRCERHGGIFAAGAAAVNCQTPTVPVSCEYFDVRQAICSWPGIENQIAVIRVIGTIPQGYTASLSSDDDASLDELVDNGGIDGGNGGGGNGGGGLLGPKDLADAPNNDPKPNWDGPKDFQLAP